MLKSLHRPQKKSSAQAMVEFALALPVLLLVVYGLLETGRLLFIYATTVTAARQAARYGSATGDNGSGTNYYNDCSGIQAAARRLEFIQRFTQIDIAYDNGPGGAWQQGSCPIPVSATGHPANGDRIRVTVSSLFTPIVPLVPFRPFTITSTSNRTLLVAAAIEVSQPGQGFGGGGTGTQGLTLTKSASQDTYDHIGEVIYYTFSLQNSGTTDIAGPFDIIDNRMGTDPFQCGGSLAVLAGGGGSISCQHTYIITAGDLTSPEVTNHATGQTRDGAIISNTATYTISFIPHPHISLVKTATQPNGSIDVGTIIQYTFTITNDGNMPLQKPYTINDDRVDSWICPTTPDILAVNATVDCSGTYALRNSDISNGLIHNSATASAKNGAATITSAAATADVALPVFRLTGVAFTPNPVLSLGQRITYTYSFLNRGTRTLSSITVTDSRWGTFLCPGITVAAGASGTCTWTPPLPGVTQDDFDKKAVISNVTVSGTQSGPNRTWTSNTVPVSVTTDSNARLTLTKTIGSLTAGSDPHVPYAVGTNVTYSYTIQNTGNMTLKAPYTIKDSNPVIGTFSCTFGTDLGVGSGAPTCNTRVYALTQADLDAGSVTNTAYATALTKILGETVRSDDVTARVGTYIGPRIGIVKTATPALFAAAGDTLSYTYQLRNTGSYDLTVVAPYVLFDNKTGTITCGPVAALAIGASAPCGTANYTVTAADDGATSVTNTVSVTAGSTTSGSPDATVTTGTSLTVHKFICTPNTLKHSGPSPIPPMPSGQTVFDWTITNNTGAPVHIGAITLQWNAGNLINLMQVFLGGISIWGPGANRSGGPLTLPNVPPGGWTLNYNNAPTTTVLRLTFSANTSGIQILVTFLEPSCNFSLNSNIDTP